MTVTTVLQWDPDEFAINEDAYQAACGEAAGVKHLTAIIDPMLVPVQGG